MSIKTINSQLPKVTICVPVRNGARTIQRTLDSLLNQDYPNYEIIVSDNCSDDDTANIVSQYASRGVKYFINPDLEKCEKAIQTTLDSILSQDPAHYEFVVSDNHSTDLTGP